MPSARWAHTPQASRLHHQGRGAISTYRMASLRSFCAQTNIRSYDNWCMASLDHLYVNQEHGLSRCCIWRPQSLSFNTMTVTAKRRVPLPQFNHFSMAMVYRERSRVVNETYETYLRHQLQTDLRPYWDRFKTEAFMRHISDSKDKFETESTDQNEQSSTQDRYEIHFRHQIETDLRQKLTWDILQTNRTHFKGCRIDKVIHKTKLRHDHSDRFETSSA